MGTKWIHNAVRASPIRPACTAPGAHHSNVQKKVSAECPGHDELAIIRGGFLLCIFISISQLGRGNTHRTIVLRKYFAGS